MNTTISNHHINAFKSARLAAVAILLEISCCRCSTHDRAAFVLRCGDNRRRPSQSQRERHPRVDLFQPTFGRRCEGDGCNRPIFFSSPTTTSLGVTSPLHEVMDDDVPPFWNNSDDDDNYDRLAERQRRQRQKQKMTQQLLNLSTQQIERELENAHGVSTAALRGKEDLVEALVDARMNGRRQERRADANDIDANYATDVEAMGVAEIKRELQLYGVATDFLDKRDLEKALMEERRIRGNRTPEAVGFERQQSPQSSAMASPMTNDGAPSSAEMGDAGDDDNQSSKKDSAANLRELQIAFEFERVQSSLPDPADIQSELEAKFNISTKYFLGTTEMAYALAVSRVDDAIERRRLGVTSDGCIVGESGDPIPISKNKNGNDDGEFECLTEEDLLPTPEELIAMEYDNLYHLWDLASLSSELENQYGIPAKHFMGKREMAYALAVERVDQAMKEGAGLIYDSDEDAEGEGGAGMSMTDEDMMRMMEEEMRREEEDDRRRRAEEAPARGRDAGQNGRERNSFGDQSPSSREEAQISGTNYGEADDFGRTPNESVRDSPKTFKKRGPNPFQKNKPPPRPTYQSTPLADMIKDGKRRKKDPPPRRTPLSEEQHSFERQRQRRWNLAESGSVIGELDGNAPSGKSKETKSLTDILKGSERQKGRSRATPQPPPMIVPPMTPRAKTRDGPGRSPNSKKVFTTSSSRFDESFKGSARRSNSGSDSRGYSSSWNKQGGSNASWNSKRGQPKATASNASDRGYSASWDKNGSSQTSQSSSSSSSSSPSSQRPFEPAPFTAPGTHNSAQSATSSAREPKRVPPKTPFQSPVTNNNAEYTRRNSQGPFTPFTPPGKRSTNGKPPPRKRPSATDPRGFNIKDTPDNTQPFVGSQAYVDMNTPYSPPLQVEPPPRDPDWSPPERPFEPAPFMDAQPHAVRTERGGGAGGWANGRAAGDRWNRANVPPRPPPNNVSGDRRREKQQPKRRKVSSSSSPFDNLKDIFDNIANRKSEKSKGPMEVAEEAKGFRYGDFEVFSTSDEDEDDDEEDDGWPPNTQGRRAVEAKIIDVETWEEEEEDVPDWAPQRQQQPPSHDIFSNAWNGGQKSVDATPSPSSFVANGVSEGAAASFRAKGVPDTTRASVGSSSNDHKKIAKKASQLLSQNAKVRAIVARACQDPRLREALRECEGNPEAFGKFLEDSKGIGPLLSELRDCII